MRVDGLNDFLRDLENSTRRTPAQLEACVNRIGARLLRSVKLKSPVDSGQLRRTWRFAKVGQYEGIIENNCTYAGFIEYGHRTRNGSVVDGRYMLKRSIEEIESVIGEELGFIIDNLL